MPARGPGYEDQGNTTPMPCLHRLNVEVRGGARPQSLHMPWSQLTELTLCDAPLANSRGILLQCTNLVSASLSVAVGDFDSSDVVDVPLVELSFLTKLQVTFDPDDNEIQNVEPFFAPLALPAWKILHLSFMYNDVRSWPAREFPAFQGRSPNITDLAPCSVVSQSSRPSISRLAASA